MFRAQRPIFRGVRTAVRTTVGSVSVPLCVLWPVLVTTVTKTGHNTQSTCFGPTGPSSGEFVQLFTRPLVQLLCRSVRVLCVLWPVLVITVTKTGHNTQSTCFGPTDPSSGEFVQLFTRPLVQFPCRSARVLCVLWPVLVTILYYSRE